MSIKKTDGNNIFKSENFNIYICGLNETISSTSVEYPIDGTQPYLTLTPFTTSDPACGTI